MPLTEIDPLVPELEKRCAAIGRSLLSVARNAEPRIHHSLVLRWRSGAARPTLRTLRTVIAAIEAAEREAAAEARAAARARERAARKAVPA